ncbi:MAG: CE1 family esterase [Acidobacteriaceae bacterium]
MKNARATPVIGRKPLFLLSIALTIAGVQPLAAQLESHPFAHNGYSRPYLLYRPRHLPSRPPVVFMLGGIRSTAKSASLNFGWMEEADHNGFLVVFPEPVATEPNQPMDRQNNVTFWEMQGSRSHRLAPGRLPVDDDGYLMSVLHDVLRREHADRNRIFFAGFSSGSGMVQLLAARHAKDITAIVAVATPLMEPPARLVRPMPILYIHGDNDEQFSGFETHTPHFATTPHGNWVTWGYLDGCKIQTAEKTNWGVRFSWQGCSHQVPVIADFVANLGHEWAGSLDSGWNKKHRPDDPLNFTDMAWHFFAEVHSK